MSTTVISGSVSPMLQRVHAYWDTARAGGKMPLRQNLRLETLGLILRSSYLVNVVHSPLDFEFRAVGGLIVDMLGVDYSHQRLSQIEWTPWFGDRLRRELTEVVMTGEPARHEHRFLSLARYRQVDFERLALPITNDGYTVSQILCVRQDRMRNAVIEKREVAMA
jgi:hypothetical protein